ncbi:MAG: ATP-binding protein [Candidatus Moranbacteria bacterium]|nr:ATP-binding protein [Candidatus Moranbacteria bacterium]
MNNKLIKEIVVDQRSAFESRDGFVPRNFPQKFLTSRKISVISGIRRSGKSTLLKQISLGFSSFSYLNFEDERMLDFSHQDFNALYGTFLELYGEQEVYLFDEIQNISGWEKFVRRLFEDGKKIFVTGSNAKLLSSELATTLSGRHIKFELYPFSFREFLKFHDFPAKKNYTTVEKGLLRRRLNQYMEYGGFPEVVVSRNKEELKQLYQDVLMKDLLVRFKIRETKGFRDVALFLLSNVSTPVSFNSIRNLLGIRSVTSVKNYVDYFEEAYLFYSLFKFDYSVKKQIINDRKIYCVDTGIVNAVAFRFSENVGRMIENLVFIELKRRGADVFYFKGKKECDFLVRNGLKAGEAIQVTEGLGNSKTEKREIDGLLEAMEKFKLKKGLIITRDEEGIRRSGGKAILVVPLWKWLLENQFSILDQ